tara:strand:+ start:3672 stop:4283 length:612 start_codon:yes stop_codon:yes gene_type:complete
MNIFSSLYFFLLSKIIILYLKLRGVVVDFKSNFRSFPSLTIKGVASNIIIGKIQVLGKIDIRNRENGKIFFEDNVKIEKDCRFVSARDGKIKIGKHSIITMGAIINGGGNVIIGENCILGPRIVINANDHVFKKNFLIKDQGFIHKDVIIEDDCWFGANVVVNKGVHIKYGSVLGASCVVTKDTEINSINAGVPAKKISERKT